uniref:ABC-type xenobiotic transporter n=1 Tax=Schistocephalus solidus TaxID=70667 RepID=A0A0X3P018_SCHSO
MVYQNRFGALNDICQNFTSELWINNSLGLCVTEVFIHTPISIVFIILSVGLLVPMLPNISFERFFAKIFYIRFLIDGLMLVKTSTVVVLSTSTRPTIQLSGATITMLHLSIELLTWLAISVNDFFHGKSCWFHSRGPHVLVFVEVVYMYTTTVLLWAVVSQMSSQDNFFVISCLATDVCLVALHLISRIPIVFPVEEERSMRARLVRTSQHWNRLMPTSNSQGQTNSEVVFHGSTIVTGVSSESNAGWLSRLFFTWIDNTVTRGYYGELLSPTLLPPISTSLDADSLGKVLIISDNSCISSGKPPISTLSLFKRFFSVFGKEFAALGFIKFLFSSLGLTSPIFLNKFLSELSLNNPSSTYAIIWGSALIASKLVTAFLGIAYDYWIPRFGFKCKMAVTGTVYRQLLIHKSSRLSKFSTGNLVNLLTSDTERIVNFTPSINELWALPVQFFVALALLYLQLGVSCLVGVAFLFILLPINRYVANRIGKYSSDLMYHKDIRVKFISELLLSMTTIKLACLELPMSQKILGARKLELKALRGQKLLDACCVFLWAACPALLAGSTFATFAALGNELRPAEVFTSLALLNMLIAPLNAFPWVINGIMEALVSTRRICCLFDLPESQPRELSHVSPFSVNPAFEEECQQYEGSTGPKKELLPSKNNFKLSICAERFYWETADKPALVNIDLSISEGQLIGVIGPVASGKSSLLLAIMNELQSLNGQVSYIYGQSGAAATLRFAYVGLTPWLQKGTVRENILFGEPADADWLQTVIAACGLELDLQKMPHGLDSEIGEAGSLLSGGQRARVALARAIYQRADVYLLDDPLAALDAHVARALSKQCLGKYGLLAGKTRIVATHQPEWLLSQDSSLGGPADLVICLSEGKIAQTYSPNSKSPAVFTSLNTPPAISHCQGPEPNQVDSEAPILSCSACEDPDVDECAPLLENDTVRCITSRSDHASVNQLQHEVQAEEEYTNCEKLAYGKIASRVYMLYARSVGYCLTLGVLLSLTFMQATRNGLDFWLSFWMKSEANTTTPNISYTEMTTFPSLDVFYPHSLVWLSDQPLSSLSTEGRPAMEHQTGFYLVVYGGLIAANLAFTSIRAVLFAFAGLAAAATIHKRILDSVLQGEISFFESTPVGRILNRFSSDVGTVDDSLPFRLNIFLAVIFGLLGSMVVTCLAMPTILIVCLPLVFVYWSVQRVYRGAARDLKRLASIARSPVYAHFSETIAGLVVIRGLRKEEAFQATSGAHLNEQTRCELASLAASAWLNLRLQMIAVLAVAFVVFAAICGRLLGWTDVSLAGLAVIYALMLANQMTATVSIMTDTEKDFVAVERCRELEEETPWEPEVVPMTIVAPERGERHLFTPRSYVHQRGHTACSSVDSLWPQEGNISLQNVYLTYPAVGNRGLTGAAVHFALEDVCLEIKAGERLGIVGRTGSGKSSILRVLFRLVNHLPGPYSSPEIAAVKNFRGATGYVRIDGVDIRGVPLNVLRNRLLCIAQDPFLFSSTVRDNLDPTGTSSEDVLTGALLKCGLIANPEEAGRLLDLQVGETGRALSAGQRQLLCLARALLRRPRPQIVCLDEATASLDDVCEENIHNVLVTEFYSSTVLLVAHRLSSVLRFCSRVVVMSNGRVAETGHPATLARDPDSLFAKMLREQNLTPT